MTVRRAQAVAGALMLGAVGLGGCSVSADRPSAAIDTTGAATSQTTAADRARTGFMTYFEALKLFNSACLKSGPAFAEADAVFADAGFDDLTDFALWGDYDSGLFGSVWETGAGALTCVVIVEQGSVSSSSEAMERLIDNKYGPARFETTEAPAGVHRLWRLRNGVEGPMLAVTEAQFFNNAVFGVALTAGAAPDLENTARPERRAETTQQQATAGGADRPTRTAAEPGATATR